MAKKATTKKSPAKKAATKVKSTTTAKAPSKKAAASTKTSTAKKKSATTAVKSTSAKSKTAATKTKAKTKTSKKKITTPVKKVAVAKKLPNLKPIGSPLTASIPTTNTPAAKPKKLPVAFLRKQQQKLLDLRDSIVSQMNGVARETLRGAGDGSQSSFGMHQADAGSDSYDRDFALNLLSKEQDALEEIDKALHRIELGTYGVCEESGEPIPQPRLEAMPFARMTVACQERMDQQEQFGTSQQSVTSLFGLDDKDKKVSS